MVNTKLLEAVADIAYYAGAVKYTSGDSRLDASEFIYWAKEFENLNKKADWDQRYYILEIEEFAKAKIREVSRF
ncbi:MAG: hypothetical protein RIB71_23920 [Imperialibacter sp.]|uniref:hypothetical protein n=1 Tax=Imperialibacter sp. TaxID=2038411 RepID=UPI0032EAF547